MSTITSRRAERKTHLGCLTLDRREGETIDVPEIGLSITVEHCGPSRVKLCIRAPRRLRILRRELLYTAGNGERTADDFRSEIPKSPNP
jgi:sRNA-binding carbon storage regulator CsrA